MPSLNMGYGVYLVFTIGMTIFVGYTLHRHGRVFLIDVFHGNSVLADTVNHLLLVGFYLTNVALVLIQLRSKIVPVDALGLAHIVSDKIGIVLMTLGFMHFANVAALMLIRRRRATSH